MKPITIVKINSSTFQLINIGSKLVAKISDEFSWLPPGYQFQPKFRLLGTKGVKIRMVQVDGSFPAGLFSEIYQFLTEDLGKKVILSDDVMEHFLPLNDLIKGGIRDDVFSDYEFEPGQPVILRDYQLGAVQAAFENRHCLLNLSTGSGKCLGPKTKLKMRVPKDLAEKYNLEVK